MKKHKYLAAIALSAFLTAASVLPSLSAGAATASISDWKAYNASAATNTVIEETDSGIQVTGTVGVANNENSLVVLQGVPLNMNTIVSFDFSMDYDTEEVRADRWFAILFNEMTISADGVADTSNMMLSTPQAFGSKVGMQINFSSNADWYSNPRFGMNAFNNYTGYVKSETLNSDFWEKLNAGESVHIQVVKDEEAGKYIVTAEDLVYESPVNQIGDGRDYQDGQAYLGFLMYNSASRACNLNYTVENLVNGYIADTVIKQNGEVVSEVSLAAGSKAQFTAELTPAISGTPIPDETIVWSSDKPEVAEVSANGEVTAKKGGNAIIRATNAEGTYCEVEITVPVESMSVDETAAKLNVGETLSLKAAVSPADAVVSYRSLAPEIATVDANGIVTGVRSGRVQIEISCGQFTETVELEIELESIGAGDLMEPIDYGDGSFSVQQPEQGAGKTVLIAISSVLLAGGAAGIICTLVVKKKK